MDCFFYLWITFSTNLKTITFAEKVVLCICLIENWIWNFNLKVREYVYSYYFLFLHNLAGLHSFLLKQYITYTNLVQLYRFEANKTNKTCKPFCLTPAINFLRCLEEILRNNITSRNIHCMDLWNTTDLTTRSKLPRAFLVYLYKSQTAIFVS